MTLAYIEPQIDRSPHEAGLWNRLKPCEEDTDSISKLSVTKPSLSSLTGQSVAVGRISLSRTLAIRAVCRANHGTHSVQETDRQEAGRSRDPLLTNSSERANGSKESVFKRSLGLPLPQNLN